MKTLFMKIRIWLIKRLVGKKTTVFMNGCLRGTILCNTAFIMHNVNQLERDKSIESKLLRDANKILFNARQL